MFPYVSSFGMRNGISAVPNPLMGLSQSSTSTPLIMGLPSSSGVTPLIMSSMQPTISPSLVGGGPVQLSINNKDSQWLTLEVCREYQRGMCPRSDQECKYAHPPAYLETSSGRVVCCYDSIKGKCHRVKPPCKYLHPPQHLKDILIQNGKNNLLMKNLQMNIIQQQLSSLSSNTQSRLEVVPMNSKIDNDSAKAPTIETSMPMSSNNHGYANLLNVSKPMINTHAGIPFSTQCQTTHCLSNAVLSGAPISMTAPSSLPNNDSFLSKKRSLSQVYQNGIKSELTTEDPVPIKRPVLSETHFPTLVMNRDTQLNPMGYLVNPFMAYQNPLTTFLALNNQSNLHSNILNMPAFVTNNSHLQPIAPGFLCQNPQSAVNNLSLMANLQNQQQLAMVLNAANGMQGNRTFSEFATYK